MLQNQVPDPFGGFDADRAAAVLFGLEAPGGPPETVGGLLQTPLDNPA